MSGLLLRISIILPAVFVSCPVAAETSYKPDSSGHERMVMPFVEMHCIGCHGPEKQKGKLRLDDLPHDFTDPHAAAKWAEVVDAVNGHEMPPEEEEQPDPVAAGKFADWIAAELGRAEISKRSSGVVMRRLNRAEYDNTIRDLTGVDFNPSAVFPEDPPAGGFDNIGQALTISPLQMELYFKTARQVLDRALVEGEKPPVLKWRFEPEDDVAGGDKTRISIDGQNPILNKGDNNPSADGFTLYHLPKSQVNIRDFKFPHAGNYIIRFRAAGTVPTREEVVASAEKLLEANVQRRIKEDQKGEKWFREESERDLVHFKTDNNFDYGAPRFKLIRDLNGTPEVIEEMDIPAKKSDPGIYEVPTWFSTDVAGIVLQQAYTVPRALENFQYITHLEFARPAVLLDWVEIEGPILPQWPPASHSAILIDSPGKDGDEMEYAREILANFMPKAYRRPVSAKEIDVKLALFKKHREGQASFIEAIKIPLTSVLISPGFLYLTEPHIPAAGPTPLTGYQLASRLSYFLWSTMPDAELMRLANSGEILKPATLTAQAKRMIADPKSAAFVKNFAGQWLGLRKVGANPPVETLYPKYDRHLEISIVRETEGFFSEILNRDLDARNFLKSDFVTINERLARFYKIPGVKGDEIRPVKVGPEIKRGGILTQASIHSITSNGTRTSPVVRGTWILETILGTDPGLPVANVGEIASQVPGIDKATVRQRLAIHRENPSCARCHDKIDPLGLAMENYNAAGEWRDQEGHGYQGRIEKNDPLIDASAKMPDGTEFIGIEGLQEQLLNKEDLFLNSLSTQLHTYALGRELGFSDRPAVKSSIAHMKKNGRSIGSLIEFIITSPAFTTK